MPYEIEMRLIFWVIITKNTDENNGESKKTMEILI